MHCFRYGVVFHGMRDNHLEVTFHGEMRRYKLLHVLEFDATRKRMSVIIQTEKGGCLCVFTCLILRVKVKVQIKRNLTEGL